MALTITVGSRTYNYSHCIGTLYTSRGGQDYVLDSHNEDVMYVISRAGGADVPFGAIQRWAKWDLVKDEAIFETSTLGTEDGNFLWPAGVAQGPDGNIYISDEYLNRISVFSSQKGAFLGKWGVAGTGRGQVNGPAGMRFDKEGNLYVVESQNNRVQKFTKDGRSLGMWGEKGSGPGQFDTPFGIHIDANGDVFVADWGNNRVQKFSPDGRFLKEFGAAGAGRLLRPTGIATDADGDVYVADWGNDRLQIFDADANPIASLYGDARELSKQGQRVINANPDFVKARRRADTTAEWKFFRPIAVTVNSRNEIIVMESLSGRLQVYKKEKDYVEAQFNL
jgi:DNA-binding beta-propeller fold protein YncE